MILFDIQAGFKEEIVIQNYFCWQNRYFGALYWIKFPTISCQYKVLMHT